MLVLILCLNLYQYYAKNGDFRQFVYIPRNFIPRRSLSSPPRGECGASRRGGAPPPPQAVPRPHGAEFGAGCNARYSPPRGGEGHVSGVGGKTKPHRHAVGERSRWGYIPTYENTPEPRINSGKG
jgi:hypothetical protein